MSPQFIAQLVVATLLAMVCVAIHGIGLFNLTRILRGETTIERLRHIDPLSPRGTLFTLGVVFAMFLLHGLEILVFALAFLVLGAISAFEDAFYFSAISYSTVGYHDTHMAQSWRMLGAFESVLGIFLLGWSTAFFFRLLGRIEAH
jgi:hypothetical protein